MQNHQFILVFSLLIVIMSCSKNKTEVDIVIINGTVYNGIDSIPANNVVAINDDKILYIGKNQGAYIAKTTIDATGMIVSPGFIDAHTHADRDLNDAKKSHNKPFLFQGVTTVIVGNDGSSYYPISDYRDKYNNQGIGTNAVLLVGHGTIRKQIVGNINREATSKELVEMEELVQQEMNSGAFGMSTGLFYAPGSFANTDEVIAMAKIVAVNGGIYDTHLRDESTYSIGLQAAIEEAIEIGRQAKLPIHLSHIKCLGVDVWRQSDSIIELIEKAQNEGIDVTANQYPYTASATSLKAAVVPRWAESGGQDSLFLRYKNPLLREQILNETKRNIKRRGGADKLLIVKATDTSLVGKNLLEIAESLETTPEKATFKVLQTGVIKIASFNMNPYDINNFMKQQWVVTGSDGNTGHPRKYGSFPRKYSKYVQQDSLISVASFINNSSSKTADIYKIPFRGKLKEGYFADIIIFDPNNFRDKADYSDAFQLSEGIKHSIINGKLAIEDGKFVQSLNGRVLQKRISTADSEFGETER